MTSEDAIKAEVRLFALESIVCQFFGSLYRKVPRADFEAVKQRAVAGARQLTFPGFADAAYSDATSAELEAAIERLYQIIQQHLESGQTDQTRERP